MGSAKEYFGEFSGTFLLVFIGCGSVALAVVYGVLGSLLEVALVWGVGVALAIFISRNWCPAHLNPAVSLAFCLKGELPIRKLPLYAMVQTLGAFSAAALLYAIIQGDLAFYEASNEWVRGGADSYYSAVMFGEFFPNPGYEDVLDVSVGMACLMEAFGTFLLVLIILWLVGLKLYVNAFPPLVGLTVTLIICFVAPYTQAGLNPARDFGPRIWAYFAGWGDAAFPAESYGFLTVYILSPLAGGALAVFVNRFFVREKKLF